MADEAHGQDQVPETQIFWQDESGQPTGAATPGGAGSGRGGSRRTPLLVAAAALVVLAVSLMAYSMFHDSDVVTPAVAGTVSPTPPLATTTSVDPSASSAAPSPSESSTEPIPTEPTPTEPSPTEQRLPADAVKICSVVYDLATGPQHSAVNSVTTCEFAENVRQAYVDAGGDHDDQQLEDVYSPRTHLDYDMDCTGGDLVRCTGGNNAVVYLYG